jgi:osmoprotectant transport system permease protein
MKPGSLCPGSAYLCAAVLLAALPHPAPVSAASGKVVVASKNFEESRLLAEMFARLIEARTGLAVERRFNLAGTQVCFEALRNGAVDVYPEYTGTGIVVLLGESPGSAAQVRERVRDAFRERWELEWLDPLGFENAYAIAVRGDLARDRGLATITDLAAVSADLSAGFGYEFIEREDGLPGLARTYGLAFDRVLGMQQALKYEAAGSGRIDALDVYTTDGRLLDYDLVVLEDDRDFFPPYEAAALAREETLREHPGMREALAELGGRLDVETMQRWNRRLQEDGEPVERVAADALAELGLVEPGEVKAVSSRGRSWISYLWAVRGEILRRTVEHLGLSGMGLLLGVALAMPLGLVLVGTPRLAEPVIRTVGVTQTIPSIALLAFMIPLAGVGALPAVLALWIYSLFPILRNTYTGVRDADPAAVQAARALGMTGGQILRWVRLPLAAPFIMAGIRTAAVLTVGTATLAAFIGAGGLGVPIVSGLQLADTSIILSGAVPAALLAVLVDLVLGWVEGRLRPPGLETNP